MRDRLNIRSALIVVVAAGILAGGVFVTQRWQVRRHAPGLLDMARAAAGQGRLDRAGGLFTAYLRLVPDDTVARAEYAALLEQTASDEKSGRAVAGVLEAVLAQDPGRADLRTRLVRLYARLGLYPEAAGHLAALGAERGGDPELLYLSGVCCEAAGDAAQAEARYRRALGLDPKSVARSLRLAALLRRQGDAGVKRADQVVDQMVAASPADAAAHLARARYRLAHRGGDPAPDLAAALRLAPTDAGVRLTAAAAAKDPAAARAHLLAALARDPHEEQVYRGLAGLDLKAGNPTAAAAVLKQGLAILPGSEPLLFAQAEVALIAGDLTEAGRVVGEIDRWKRSPERAAVLRGRVRAAAGDWRGARAVLEAVRPRLTTSSPALAADADTLLGRCHEQAGEDDLALTAYRRAADDRSRTDAQVGAARVLVRLGRVQEAVALYRGLTAAPDAPPDVWVTYARLRTVERLAGGGPGAGDLEEVFAQAEKRAPGAADLVVLRAEVMAADGRPADARRLLEEAFARRPDAPVLGLALARLLSRQGDAAGAWRELDGMGATAGAEVGWHLARLDLLAGGSDPRAAGVLAAAEQRAAAAPAGGRARLMTGLADAYTRWRRWPDAERCWREVARQQPADLGVRFRLLDLALQMDDGARVEEAVREVHQAEGGEGAFGHYAEALARVARPQDRTPVRLREARQHLTAAGSLRPTWASVPYCRAVVDELEGKPDDALANYVRAADLGDRRPVVVRRAVALLCARRRFPDAERLLQRAAAGGRGEDRLDRLAAEVSLYNANPRRAVELAEAAVAPASPDYADHLWQAEILAAAGRPAEATAALRRAVDVAGPVGAPWVALVRHLTRTNQRPAAEAALADLGRRLGGVERDLATAQCLDLLGRAADAANAYRAALATHSTDLGVVRQVIGYNGRTGNAAASIPVLRRLLADPAAPPPADLAWVRRALAESLAAGGAYPALQEALSLIDQNLAADPGAAADLEAKARVLASHPAHRRDAVRVAEQLRRQGPLAPDAEFLLGQLLADTGRWADGRRAMTDVITREGDDPARLEGLVGHLVRHEQFGDAAFWVGRLETVARDDPTTVRLRAAVWARLGREADAADYLRGYVRGGGGNPGRVRVAARAADEAAKVSKTPGPLEAVADEWYARAAGPGEPADVLAHAGYLGRHGRLARALEMCRAAEPKAGPAAVAGTLVGVAYARPNLPADDLAALDREVTACLARGGASPPADLLAGAMHARCGRYKDAAGAFGRAAAAGAGPEAVNNQAYMLALAGDADQAVRLADAAARDLGPTSGLLDTRGVAHLAAGRAAEAVADLEAAVEQEPTAARLVHLAAAYEKVGRAEDAKRAVAKAAGPAADGALVLPVESAEYARLRAGVGPIPKLSIWAEPTQ